MNLLFTSQCHKNALTETRRILDQFAERKGDRTWQTPMTEQGLKTVHRLLRKSARKNTAVACHWIRGKNKTELVWIVGDKKQFNETGTVPTNITRRDILRTKDENDWHTGEIIYLVTGLAALFHDLGKATDAFQNRLRNKGHEGRNVLRHEWISLRLFESFVANESDEAWLSRLCNPQEHVTDTWLQNLTRDSIDFSGSPSPFNTLPPIAKAIAWLILSHHRVPKRPGKSLEYFPAEITNLFTQISPYWNESRPSEQPLDIQSEYWTFSRGLPVVNDRWRRWAQRLGTRMLAVLSQSTDLAPLENPYLMHVSRMSLMLADHQFSRREMPSGLYSDNALYANTKRDFQTLNQGLADHLIGVTQEAGYIIHGLTNLRPSLSTIARHKALRKRSKSERFRWQDKAADLAQSIRTRSESHGAFLINMASTGAGKTFANARILYALADPQRGARFTVALGLRTLTQQTGKAYQKQLQLNDRELAIRVGGVGSKKMFEHFQTKAEHTGSESTATLIHDAQHIHYEGNYEGNLLLQRVAENPSVRKLIDAPVLVCTIDHLMPASESQRGGHQIGPMLRLLSSDIVIDEVDDFGLEDLPAISRFVYMCGLLGSRVMLSSATLPPALVEGLFNAYSAGRREYQKNRGRPNTPLHIPCAWFDEYGVQTVDCSSPETFADAHVKFATQRAEKLASSVVRRLPEFLDVSDSASNDKEDLIEEVTEDVIDTALRLHETHGTWTANRTHCVSFGLIRMANIKPLVQVAREIYASARRPDTTIHLCVYHSQHPFIQRSHMEHVLDTTLGKDDSEPRHMRVADAWRRSNDRHHIFIVLASPVAEVGRDHDYDWAIVEPSSVRSMIQLAGRVRRHRFNEIDTPNIAVWTQNVRALNHKAPAYIRPGFEGRVNAFKLVSHDLPDLLQLDELNGFRSTLRITERSRLRPKHSFTDLEHARLRHLLLPSEPAETSNHAVRSLTASDWWTRQYATYSYLSQQWKPFRQQNGERTTVIFSAESLDEELLLHEVQEFQRGKTAFVKVEDSKLIRLPHDTFKSDWIRPWAVSDLNTLLSDIHDEGSTSLQTTMAQFTRIDLYQSTKKWLYHLYLGLFSTYVDDNAW